jgi:hypothetical protein
VAETPQERDARHALNQPLIAEFDRLAAQARREDPDDPLAGMEQSPLDERCETPEEERRRSHVAEFVLDMIDPLVTDEDVRLNALRHVLACDPARAIGLLVTLVRQGNQALEEHFGDAPGTAVKSLRDMDREVRALKAEGRTVTYDDLTQIAQDPHGHRRERAAVARLLNDVLGTGE